MVEIISAVLLNPAITGVDASIPPMEGESLHCGLLMVDLVSCWSPRGLQVVSVVMVVICALVIMVVLVVAPGGS